MSRWLGLFFVAILVFAADFFFKGYIHTHIALIDWSSPLYPYGGIPVFHNWHGIDFSINHAINKGAAWGLMASFQDYLLYLRVGVIGALISYLLFFNRVPSRSLPLTLVVAGALGNVVDYFVYGHVVDMFFFKFWGYVYPIFNIADSAIFCGIALMFLQSFFKKSKSPQLVKTVKAK